MARWGLVTTTNGTCDEVIRFAAHHLNLGADRLDLYLDTPNPQIHAALGDHPKIMLADCNDAYWQALLKRRPVKHQQRQTRNATRSYTRADDLDWLIHLDVDEFLIANTPICDILDKQPDLRPFARARPVEALAGSEEAFKRFIPRHQAKSDKIDAIYPEYGRYLNGGFISHVQGKIFLRTKMEDIEFRIHNAFQNGTRLDGQADLDDVKLAHFHAKSFHDWLNHYRYRIEHGSYRAELRAGPQASGVTLHALFQAIEQEYGEAGLRAFFDETIADSPDLRARLKAQDALFEYKIDFQTALERLKAGEI